MKMCSLEVVAQADMRKSGTLSSLLNDRRWLLDSLVRSTLDAREQLERGPSCIEVRRKSSGSCGGVAELFGSQAWAQSLIGGLRIGTAGQSSLICKLCLPQDGFLCRMRYSERLSIVRDLNEVADVTQTCLDKSVTDAAQRGGRGEEERRCPSYDARPPGDGDPFSLEKKKNAQSPCSTALHEEDGRPCAWPLAFPLPSRVARRARESLPGSVWARRRRD